MPRPTYTLEAELAYNDWTDITPDLHVPTPLIIERGAVPGERVAGAGRMRLALYNPDGRYTPGHANATPGFEVGIGLRLSASDGLTMYPLFTGRLAEIGEAEGEDRGGFPDLTGIVVSDDIARLERLRLGAFPLQLNVTPRDLVNQIIDRAFVPVGAEGFFRVGHPAAGRLGESTILGDALSGKDFDAGQSVFPWAGDTWNPDLPLLTALREVCASEGGFFHIAADGTPTFRDRHARPRQVTPDAALSEKLAGLHTDRADRRVGNRALVTAYPRQIALSESVLWASSTVIRVPMGEARLITCPYRDPDQLVAVIGAREVVAPVAYTDYTATSQPDPLHPASVDLTGAVTISGELGATAARLTITSSWGGPLYLQTLQIRGKPLRAFQPVTVELNDDVSQLASGEHPFRLEMTLQEESAVAADMAHALLATRKDPHPWAVLRIEAAAGGDSLTQALARDLGDRVALTEPDLALGEEGGFFIERIRHEIREAGRSHRVTWWTSPADLESFWALGESDQSALGMGTRLAY
jgi:hypothetical protein